ncbi:MAG: hypothetical protein QOH25_636 [Acidobacteriota bacterium]|jgi:hypothetical protein|nr:hypothetical protein [Acidobacteriota bacterium]
MRKLTKLTIGAAMVLCLLIAVSPRRGSFAAQQQPDVRALTAQERAIKVSITTGGSLFGPPKNLYRVGQRVPISITMTNTSDQPVQVCVSGTLYQDLPKLIKDGQPVRYLTLQSQMLKADQKYNTCSEVNLPEPVLLQPREARVVDWFILAEGKTIMGDLAWYDQLQAGKYELSIERRLSCCDGPMVESNKINFEVVP